LPKNDAGTDAWVDEWGAAEDGNAERGVRSAEDRSEALAAIESPGTDDPDAAEPAAQPELSWREMMRRTPLWVWLISTTALFGICAMFVTVMLVIALSK
jgi:hypothetical protein